MIPYGFPRKAQCRRGSAKTQCRYDFCLMGTKIIPTKPDCLPKHSDKNKEGAAKTRRYLGVRRPKVLGGLDR